MEHEVKGHLEGIGRNQDYLRGTSGLLLLDVGKAGLAGILYGHPEWGRHIHHFVFRHAGKPDSQVPQRRKGRDGSSKSAQN